MQVDLEVASAMQVSILHNRVLVWCCLVKLVRENRAPETEASRAAVLESDVKLVARVHFVAVLV